MSTSSDDTHTLLETEKILRHEVQGLADDDILALCYAFQHRADRLRLYLDVLRGRGGERAQFAACLIGYDLARQGDTVMQQEFILLSSTMLALSQKPHFVETLIGEDAYLSFIWELCQEALSTLSQASHVQDPAHLAANVVAHDRQNNHAPINHVNLLSDQDFDNFELSADDAVIWRQFDEAVETFLGGVPGVPMYDLNAGFRYQTPHIQDRVQRFLNVLGSVRAHVPPARGFRALTLLFYGTHMRSRSLFGARNSLRQQMLLEGIEEFLESGPEVASIAGVLGPMHADPDVWPKIIAVLQHYAAWLAQRPDANAAQLSQYEPPS